MRFSAFVVASALGCSVLQGCSAADTDSAPGGASALAVPSPLTFTERAVNADWNFANTVTVLDDRLVVPTESNRAMLDRIYVDAILAGDRGRRPDGATDRNPNGFLRHVLDIQVDGDNTVIMTERAELSDWILEGNLAFNDTKSTPFKGSTDLRDLSIKPLDNGGDGDPGAGSGSTTFDLSYEGPELGDFKAKPFVKLSNTNFKLNTKFDGYFRVRKKGPIPTRVEYRAHLIADPTFSADINAGVSLGNGPQGMDTPFQIPVWENTWRMNTVFVPIGGPIPLTVRFSPEVHCTVGAGGFVAATVHADVRSHAEVGFEGAATVGGFDWNDLSQAPSLSPSMQFVGVQGRASMGASCEVYGVVSVMAFDAAGLEGKVGAGIELNANACAEYGSGQANADFDLYEDHRVVAAFGARVQVPVFGVGKSFTFKSFDLVKSNPLYLVGDENTCR
jgi:hypothetical protein